MDRFNVNQDLCLNMNGVINNDHMCDNYNNNSMNSYVFYGHLDNDLRYQIPIVKIRLVHAWYVFVDCVVCVRGGSGNNVLYLTQQGI